MHLAFMPRSWVIESQLMISLRGRGETDLLGHLRFMFGTDV